MKTKLPALVIAFLLLPRTAPAWSGDTWGNITRATIKSNADLMIDSSWVPKNTFTNFQYGSTYRTYSQGVTYTGVAYSQNNPQETWSEFRNAVTNTSGGSVGYGNDCSGFVSICWKLPTREVTATFESKLGTTAKWTSLGDIGSAATAPLVMGDALNSSSVGHIVLFLNFESTGVRTMEQTPNNAQRKVRTYSNIAEYRPIRRLQISDAPAIASDGVSRVVDVGNAVSLKVSASGATPLAYRWQFNGSSLSGATSSQLTLSAAQLTNAGNYVCVVSNAYGSATSRVMSLTVYPAQTTVFLDTFDTNSAANWRVNKSSADTRVTYNYNYAAMGIPTAPRSTGGTTRGVRMEANRTTGAVAALSLSPLNQNFSGDHRLRYDMWINVNGPLPDGGTGSTEHGTGGIGTAGNRVQWTGTGSTADGCWFSADGEGGAADTSTTSGDFCAFIGASLQNPAAGVYTAGADTTAKGNLNAYYVSAYPAGTAPPALQQASYPQQAGTLTAGTVGFAWHEVIVSRRGNTVDWAIDGIRLATITNANFTASNIFIGYWDSYASLSDNTNLSFGLVDNVRVEVPVQAPVITAHPQSQSAKIGTNVTLWTAATGTTPMGYQWQFNHVDIAGATASWFTVTNVQVVNAGEYAVTITNLAGGEGSLPAVLSVLPLSLVQIDSLTLLPDGRRQLRGTGDEGGYTVEFSTNLVDWHDLMSVLNTNGAFWCFDGETNVPVRFYRVRRN